MNIVRKTLSFFLPTRDIGEGMPNQRAFTRLDGENMTVSVNGASFNVINWSQGGLLLDPSNNNIPNVDDTIDLTLQLNQGNDTIKLTHGGHILRHDDDGVVVVLNPLETMVKKQLNRMVDAVLAENFLRSQAA